MVDIILTDQYIAAIRDKNDAVLNSSILSYNPNSTSGQNDNGWDPINKDFLEIEMSPSWENDYLNIQKSDDDSHHVSNLIVVKGSNVEKYSLRLLDIKGKAYEFTSQTDKVTHLNRA